MRRVAPRSPIASPGLHADGADAAAGTRSDAQAEAVAVANAARHD
jgi:hypothetical protein